MISVRPILYAEDDENDVFLTQRAFKLAQVNNPLCVMGDGKAAIDYLRQLNANGGEYAASVPCLVLLDLKMPGQNGFDVLKWLRAESNIGTLPVLILTSSTQETDIHRAYTLGANAYLTKPGTPDDLLLLVRSIKDFWLNQNRVSYPQLNLRPPGK
jgi:CheY-like chemotaxis protein